MKSKEAIEADALYQDNYDADCPRFFPGFWTCTLNEDIYEQGHTSLYDNLRVEPDWDTLDESWSIKEGQYFDCNGMRWSVPVLAKALNLETGEEPPGDEHQSLKVRSCGCWWQVRQGLYT